MLTGTVTVPEPKSLAEYNALAGAMLQAERGIKCPHCGCGHLPNQGHEVEKTHTSGPAQSIKRDRICRNPNCRQRFTTYERVAPLPTSRKTHPPEAAEY